MNFSFCCNPPTEVTGQLSGGISDRVDLSPPPGDIKEGHSGMHSGPSSFQREWATCAKSGYINSHFARPPEDMAGIWYGSAHMKSCPPAAQPKRGFCEPPSWTHETVRGLVFCMIPSCPPHQQGQLGEHRGDGRHKPHLAVCFVGHTR